MPLLSNSIEHNISWPKKKHIWYGVEAVWCHGEAPLRVPLWNLSQRREAIATNAFVWTSFVPYEPPYCICVGK